MKIATQILTTFFMSIAQFIIGVLILADKADIRTIGWYYIIASAFMVLVAIMAAVGLAIKNDKTL